MHYTIKQMAQMFGVTEHTLRFYTGKGLRRVHRGHSDVSPPVLAGGVRGEPPGAVRDYFKAARGGLPAVRGGQGHRKIHGG